MYYDPRTTKPFIISFLILSLIPYYPFISCSSFELSYYNSIFWGSLISLFDGECFILKMLFLFTIEYLILIVCSAIIALLFVKLKYGKIVLRKKSH
ncbi:hypothetical protein J4471_02230 [Candidatus Woesearchaeota archaeon]|nr:hypothetical protein [Candidatus Woesearchaeota archaeon]